MSNRLGIKIFISISLGEELGKAARGVKDCLPRLLLAAQHRFYHRFKHAIAAGRVRVEPPARDKRRLYKDRPRGARRGVHRHVAAHRRRAGDAGKYTDGALRGQLLRDQERALRVMRSARQSHAGKRAVGYLRAAALQLRQERDPKAQVGVARRKLLILARKAKVDRKLSGGKGVVAAREGAVPRVGGLAGVPKLGIKAQRRLRRVARRRARLAEDRRGLPLRGARGDAVPRLHKERRDYRFGIGDVLPLAERDRAAGYIVGAVKRGYFGSDLLKIFSVRRRPAAAPRPRRGAGA